jgi:hypothetical protein
MLRYIQAIRSDGKAAGDVIVVPSKSAQDVRWAVQRAGGGVEAVAAAPSRRASGGPGFSSYLPALRSG